MSAESQAPGADDGQSPKARRDAWSRYWAAGAPHSCVGTYGDCYGGKIAGFWHGVFGDLPAVASVLDIATGNGVLPRMLLDARHEPGVTCDAVDIATVQPPWLARLSAADQARVRMHGGVDAAALPFDDGRFDLIVSQYGLEYTDLHRSVAELLRVRAPGGAVALVLHHAQGRPAVLAAIEIDHMRWLTRQGGWFDATEAMIEPMARAATAQGRASLHGDARANAARERFNTQQNQLTARAASGDGADVLLEVREAAMQAFTLASRGSLPAATALLVSWRAELAAAVTRLHDLSAHALRVDEAEALRERLSTELRTPVALGELREGEGHLMGWTMRTESAR